jgi:acyl carrier protein
MALKLWCPCRVGSPVINGIICGVKVKQRENAFACKHFCQNLGSIIYMDVREEIKEFVLSNLLKGAKSRGLVDSKSFLEDGIIDSLGVLELVAFLEEKFSFKVDDEEIVPENFDSIDKLVAFVRLKFAKVNS